MNREEADRITGHLSDAEEALERASRAIAGLGSEERLLLKNVVVALQSEVLAPIYEQHPDLEPEYEGGEIPHVNSELRWDQVRLPTSISEKDIDAVIFSLMKPRWQKVALIVGHAAVRCKELGLPVSAEMIAARLRVLADSGRIEDVGDLRIWRFSEVRLKD